MTIKHVGRSVAILGTVFAVVVAAEAVVDPSKLGELWQSRWRAARHFFTREISNDAQSNADLLNKHKNDFIHHAAGVREPPFEPAKSSQVPDEAPVIGVSLGDNYRAYLPHEMSDPDSHVINDLIDDLPVTVVYCDRTDCTRVMTDPRQKSFSLSVSINGFQAGQLSLIYGGVVYPLDATNLPLQDIEFTRCTWKEWKEQHPTTDICTWRMPSPEDAHLDGEAHFAE